MSTSITSPVTVAAPGFSGTSKFGSSLQQVLSRAVGIASLPLESLNAGLNKLNSQQSALQGLDLAFSGLQLAVSSLQNTVSTGLLSSSVSDGSIVKANVTGGASAGTYSIEVENLGSFSTALSTAGSTAVSDVTKGSISSAPSFTLSVGTRNTLITPASSSLQALADAINTQASGQVQATLVNTGSSASPDYRLSLRAANLGTDPIGLTDSLGSNLISTSAAGALASYKVDGTDSITSTSRSVTLSPGLTVDLLGQSAAGHAATITVRTDPAVLESSLNSLAQAYNSAVDGINRHHGQNSGALSGDSLLQSLSDVLRQLSTYSNASPSGALANFGLSLDQTGHLSLDSAAFTAASNADTSTLLSTLGDSKTGGFLKLATNLLNGVENSTDGTLKGEEDSIARQITGQQTRITDEHATVSRLQSNLTAQIARADAAIALLESRVSYVTGLFATFTGANNTQSNGLSTL
jgi:flagellar hook-associated protein 2